MSWGGSQPKAALWSNGSLPVAGVVAVAVGDCEGVAGTVVVGRSDGRNAAARQTAASPVTAPATRRRARRRTSRRPSLSSCPRSTWSSGIGPSTAACRPRASASLLLVMIWLSLVGLHCWVVVGPDGVRVSARTARRASSPRELWLLMVPSEQSSIAAVSETERSQ